MEAIDETRNDVALKAEYSRSALYQKAEDLPEAPKRAVVHSREGNGWRLTGDDFTGAGGMPAIPAL